MYLLFIKINLLLQCLSLLQGIYRPNLDIKPRLPTLQGNSLPVWPQGKPKNTGVDSLLLLQGFSQPRNQNTVSCIAGGFFTSWATMEAPLLNRKVTILQIHPRTNRGHTSLFPAWVEMSKNKRRKFWMLRNTGIFQDARPPESEAHTRAATHPLSV